MQIEFRRTDTLCPYAGNPRVNDHAVEQMVASIREYGFKIPLLVRSDGEIVDGHLRLKAARVLQLEELPVLLCDEWTPAQVKAFRLMVNRSAAWADWDLELLAFELQELNAAQFDLSLTGFELKEIDDLLIAPDADDQADAAPPLPENPVTRSGDLWICGPHRVLCGDATGREAVTRLLGASQPILMVTDPPYGIELDSEWRDRAGLNGAQAGGMTQRTAGHTHTSIASDTRADWSEAFELVPGLQAAYVWHASVFTREVLDGLLRIGFLYPQQIIWDKGRIVLTRTHYWYQHEPCWYVRKKNAPWFGKAGENSTVWDSPSPKFIMGGSDENEIRSPHAETHFADRAPHPQPHAARGTGIRSVPRQRHHARRRRKNRACVSRTGAGSEIRGRDRRAVAGADGPARRARRRRPGVRGGPPRAAGRRSMPAGRLVLTLMFAPSLRIRSNGKRG